MLLLFTLAATVDTNGAEVIVRDESDVTVVDAGVLDTVAIGMRGGGSPKRGGGGKTAVSGSTLIGR